MPTERPGYFWFVIMGMNPDVKTLTTDEDALRQALRSHVQ